MRRDVRLMTLDDNGQSITFDMPERHRPIRTTGRPAGLPDNPSPLQPSILTSGVHVHKPLAIFAPTP